MFWPKSIFAILKIAKNQFLNWEKVLNCQKCNFTKKIFLNIFHEKIQKNKKIVKLIYYLISRVFCLDFFSPVRKMIFGHFCNCKRWNMVKKNFMKLIYYLISRVFLAWIFQHFWPTVAFKPNLSQANVDKILITNC